MLSPGHKLGLSLCYALVNFGLEKDDGRRHPNQATLPGDDLKPAWRAACVAYRKVRQAGQLDQPAWLAARAAI